MRYSPCFAFISAPTLETGGYGTLPEKVRVRRGFKHHLIQVLWLTRRGWDRSELAKAPGCSGRLALVTPILASQSERYPARSPCYVLPLHCRGHTMWQELLSPSVYLPFLLPKGILLVLATYTATQLEMIFPRVPCNWLLPRDQV